MPTKPYPNYTGNGFTFTTRDPGAELTYTAQVLSEILTTNGYWATAETNAGTVLKNRYISAVQSLGTEAKTQYETLRNSIKVDIYGSTTQTEGAAYSQYLAGMSSAMGGGHTNVSFFSNVATQQREIEVNQIASQIAQTVMGNAFQATSNMPLVVPVESQLISDACASGIETQNIGEIRAQQIRQSVAAGNQLNVSVGSIISNGTIISPSTDEYIAAASINAQGAAARTT